VNLYSNKFKNLEELYKFLDTYDHPELNQEDINHLSRSITHNEIEVPINTLLKKKSPRLYGLSAEIYQTFKEKLIPTLLKLFHEKERDREHCLTLIQSRQYNTHPKTGQGPIQKEKL
jgi:hypothetical protein